MTGWDDVERDQFCETQSRCGAPPTGAKHPGAVDSIVELDGVAWATPGGRVGDRRPTVVDVALVPELAGRGLGGGRSKGCSAPPARAATACVLQVAWRQPGPAALRAAGPRGVARARAAHWSCSGRREHRRAQPRRLRPPRRVRTRRGRAPGGLAHHRRGVAVAALGGVGGLLGALRGPAEVRSTRGATGSSSTGSATSRCFSSRSGPTRRASLRGRLHPRLRTAPEAAMSDPYVGEIRMIGGNFAPMAGRSARASCCRSRSSRPCSSSSARPTAATDSPRSRCQTCGSHDPDPPGDVQQRFDVHRGSARRRGDRHARRRADTRPQPPRSRHERRGDTDGSDGCVWA